MEEKIIKLAAIFYQFPYFGIEDFLRLKNFIEKEEFAHLDRCPQISLRLKGFFASHNNWQEMAEMRYQQIREMKAKVIYPTHPDYPEQFIKSTTPPIILTYWGSPVWKKRRGLAVVGSREPRRRVLEWMDIHLSALLKKQRLYIVSGGARGVDQRAHSVCLRSGQPTVAFLPSGLDSVYPKDFACWIPQIIEGGGAVISEFGSGQKMYKGHFQQRNRLIASLTNLLFVAEARRKSGSIMTAGLALGEGRIVGTLPGFPGDIKCAGSIDLLFDGAQLIRDAEDLLSLL